MSDGLARQDGSLGGVAGAPGVSGAVSGTGQATFAAPEPGRHAVDLAWLPPYFLGSRYAAIALAQRVPEADGDAKAMVNEFDRFRHAAQKRMKENSP